MNELVYIHLPPGQSPPDLPVAPFRAVVLIEEPVSADWQAQVSEWLVRSGCLYMMAWGLDCSSWDDSVDYANIDAFDDGEIPDDKFVMTTWHDDEPLSEVFWIAGNCAYHEHLDSAPTLIIDISARDRREKMLDAYRAAQVMEPDEGVMLRRSSCTCGRVSCEGTRAPIVSTVCYCSDCQAGGHLIEALPGAPHVLDPDGGTPYLTYRDDRFACVEGAELLVGYGLKDKAPTQRFVASCCNSGMFVKFGPGHWTSAYRARFGGELPPVEMRTKMERRQSDLPLPDDAPAYRGFPMRLFGRLISARFAMLLGR